ncbi:MAG: hypothetical protein IKB38_03200 [Clostridia bacterium]|nr:hypothetical protein [Clostridia bacterium]
MRLIEKIRNKIRKNGVYTYYLLMKPLGSKMRLAATILVNAAFIVWNTVLSAVYRDPLLFAVSVYYLLLAFMRYTLLRAEKRRGKDNGQRAAFYVGILLLFADVAMGGAIVYSLTEGAKRRYSPITALPQLLFSFFCLFTALARIIHRSSALSASELSGDAITLAAAFFSVFNLVNYLSHLPSVFISVRATVTLGVLAFFSVFATAVFLLVKNKSDGGGQR